MPEFKFRLCIVRQQANATRSYHTNCDKFYKGSEVVIRSCCLHSKKRSAKCCQMQNKQKKNTASGPVSTIDWETELNIAISFQIKRQPNHCPVTATVPPFFKSSSPNHWRHRPSLSHSHTRKLIAPSTLR
uniref:Uncharacterized protein n=1 Tax=Oryza brachyantha TaxID=4533 RepID=J3LDH5_ORYBR